jgi:aerobic-type carbon monoxide dehydrogenase small subunit (CoxS/CutS family)
MADTFSINVNNRQHDITTSPTRPLLDVLREDLHLTGAKFGCGEGQCGACSVLVEGKRVFSCRTAIQSVAGKSITTIEGLAQGEQLHPVQTAFLEEGAYQCGYCTAGMIINAVALLRENPRPTQEQIAAGMNRNMCRCCSYIKILNAVKRAAGV